MSCHSNKQISISFAVWQTLKVTKTIFERTQTYTSCSLMADGSSFFFFCVFALSCFFLEKKKQEKSNTVMH